MIPSRKRVSSDLADLGLAIRDRRRKLKLSQTELARKAEVGRQWVVAIEQGKSRAELRFSAPLPP